MMIHQDRIRNNASNYIEREMIDSINLTPLILDRHNSYSQSNLLLIC